MAIGQVLLARDPKPNGAARARRRGAQKQRQDTSARTRAPIATANEPTERIVSRVAVNHTYAISGCPCIST